MRNVFGPTAVGVIIGAIALVFVFFGVYSPGGVRGGGAAATVNGDTVSLSEFNREYQQRIQYYQSMLKTNADPEMLKKLGVQRQVLEDLIRRKLLLQQADRFGLVAADEDVRDHIREMPYFKKDGKFDSALYNDVLVSNHMTPQSFETMIREDILRQKVLAVMRSSVKVSDGEVQSEFEADADKRAVEYAIVHREDVRKKWPVSDKEVTDLLANAEGMKLAKNYYEQNKYQYIQEIPAPKGKDGKMSTVEPKVKPFEDVKRSVAAEVVRDKKAMEIGKSLRDSGNDLLAKVKAGGKGVSIKTTPQFSRVAPNLGELGRSNEILADAFADGGFKQPKLYEVEGDVVVVKGVKVFKTPKEDFGKEREKLVASVTTRKEQMILDAWMTELRQKARVSVNEQINQL